MPVIVMAMLLRGTDVLLARRSPHRAAHPNLWSFPGGHVEKGETLESALRREVFEEIGITLLEHAMVAQITGSIAKDSIVFELHAARRWSGNPEIRDGDDVPPGFRTVLSWNFPLMIPGSGRGEFHEEVEVHRGADRVCPEAG